MPKIRLTTISHPDLDVVGESHYIPTLAMLHKNVRDVPQIALLVPDPKNKFDPNSIQVQILTGKNMLHHVGHLPADLARELTPTIRDMQTRGELPAVTALIHQFEGDAGNTLYSVNLDERPTHQPGATIQVTPPGQTRLLGCLFIIAVIAILAMIFNLIGSLNKKDDGPSEIDMQSNMLVRCDDIADQVFTYKHDRNHWESSIQEPDGNTVKGRLAYDVQNENGATQRIDAYCTATGVDSIDTTTVTSFIVDNIEMVTP